MVTLDNDNILMVKNDSHAVFQWANNTIVIRRSTHSPNRWWCITPSPGNFDPMGNSPEECLQIYLKQWTQEVEWSSQHNEEETKRLLRVLDDATTQDKFSIL